jgi:Leucine-rich repeat (LRR) protein
MDMSLSPAAMRLAQSGSAAYSGIREENPVRVAPVIREVIRAAAGRLMFETGLLRKNVQSSAPCFAIRTRGFDDLSLMTDALPREVWDLISGALAPEDMQMLFSTCKEMKACLEKYIVKAEQQYAESSDKIFSIASDHASEDKNVERKLAKFFDRHNFVNLDLSKCGRKPEILKALAQNKSIKLLRIEARNIARHIDGIGFGASFCSLANARIELDLADNNFWSDDNFSRAFAAVLRSDAVCRLNLDLNNFRSIKRSEVFFSLIFSSSFGVRDLSLAGTELGGFLSEFGMSVLAFGLMGNQPRLLETLSLSNTSTKPALLLYPQARAAIHCPTINSFLNSKEFLKFSYRSIMENSKGGVQLIIESLKKNSTLKAIHLSNCRIGAKMAKVIAGSLQQNATLQKLYLCGNPIRNEGIKALGKAIGPHPSLKLLDLAWNNKIERNGWSAFFAALSDNTSLRHLNLGSCGIGDKEAAALAAMLKTNRTLEELILSNNRITVEGMTELAKSLSAHPSIRLLDLAGNHIPLKHVSMLEHLVKDGIQVRVNTGSRYRTAKTNGASLATLDELNRNADLVKNEDVWLETSW